MVHALKANCLDDLSGVTHGFFSRRGGFSDGIYASLNCGPGSGDRAEAVAQNRARVADALGAEPERLISIYQIHSADVVIASKAWRQEAASRADAVVSSEPGLALGVLTADCAPVLLADGRAGVVAAAHAGWRGALDGILANTLAQMEALGADRGHVRAAVGPAISCAAYEVGDDFRQQFIERDAAYDGYFERPEGAARPHFDLPRFVADRLRAEGVGKVEGLDVCTYGQENEFFSYRRAVHRGESDYGRQISAILLA